MHPGNWPGIATLRRWLWQLRGLTLYKTTHSPQKYPVGSRLPTGVVARLHAQSASIGRATYEVWVRPAGADRGSP